MLRNAVFSVTVNSSGDGSSTLTPATRGLLYAIEYIKGNYADGHDFTLSSVNSDMTDLLYTGTNVNASVLLLPRVDMVGNTGTALGLNSGMIPFFGQLKITVAQGGNATSGKYAVWWFDD
jgi:hypothetical protein